MSKKLHNIEWKNAIRTLYNCPSWRGTGNADIRYHPLMVECGYRKREWIKLANSLEYLLHHGLIDATVKRYKEQIFVSGRVVLTRKGFDVARELEIHNDNLRMNRGIFILTGAIALLGVGNFALSTRLVSAVDVCIITFVAIMLLPFVVIQLVK